MRWKLVVIVSFVAALAAFCLWLATIHLLFGSQIPASRIDVVIMGALLPLALAAFGGVFVFRHTARRRKLHAIITSLLTLIFVLAIFVVVARIFPQQVIIPSWTRPALPTAG